MKKFMIIPAILLVFGLLVSGCDTGGDWGAMAGGAGEGDVVIYDGAWAPGFSGSFDNSDGIVIELDSPFDATGFSELVVIVEEDDDGGWAGGQLGDNNDDQHGFWGGDIDFTAGAFTFPLDGLSIDISCIVEIVVKHLNGPLTVTQIYLVPGEGGGGGASNWKGALKEFEDWEERKDGLK